MRRGIFSVIAHEMAHQWFGDLVTMAWWDNLWLNEGFASWMQEKAAERFYPDWKPGSTATAEAVGHDDDARRTAHPIQQPVADQSEAMVAFDGITYNKGQAFIRMLENYLGEEAFRDGIRATCGACLRQHHHRRSVAGARGGVRQAGHGDRGCLIRNRTACRSWSRRHVASATASASRCARSASRSTIPTQAPATWQVPVVLGAAGGTRGEAVLLDGSAGGCRRTLRRTRQGQDLGDVGYYRVQYDAASFAALVRRYRAHGTGRPGRSRRRHLGHGGGRPHRAGDCSSTLPTGLPPTTAAP